MNLQPTNEIPGGRSHSERPAFPPNWLLASDYDPNEHLMSLKGKDYLNVQHRLIWFIRDQRDMLASGLATTTYAITTDLIELDRQAGWAHFRTTVRDALGNEATAYGSESKSDFPDYIEKAGTKSVGRALLMLGYGAAFAPEMDEGERIVDAPIERRASTSSGPTSPAPASMTTTAVGKYDPMNDRPTRARLTALGYRSVAQVEEFLASVRKAGDYSERSIKQAVVALEHQAAQASQASLAGLPVGTRGD